MGRLRKTKAALPEFVGLEATDLANVKAGQGKTMIDQQVKAGQEAYQGRFAEGGVIASGYQDHGIGANLLDFKSVDLTGYPYGAWVVNNVASTDRSLVAVGSPVEQDAIAFAGALGVTSSARSFYRPQSSFEVGQPHIYSIYAFLDYAATIQLSVWQADSAADAFNQTGTANLLATGEAITGEPGGILRPKVEFSPTKQYLKFVHQITRTGGGVGTLNTAYFYNPMFEQVQPGQMQPSKFVTPKSGRGNIAANAVEGDALKQHKAGLEIIRTSGTSLTITAGAAFIPGLARVVALPIDRVLSGLVVTTSHRSVYLYEDAAGVGQVELSTTVPSAPYSGAARTKSGDTTRRFLGTVKCNADATIRDMDREGAQLIYQDDLSNRKVLTGGTNTSGTAVSCSNLVPQHVQLVHIHIVNNFITSGGTVYVSRPGGPSPGAGEGIYMVTVTANGRWAAASGPLRLSSSQNLNYAQAVAGMSCDIFIIGYWEQT